MITFLIYMYQSFLTFPRFCENYFIWICELILFTIHQKLPTAYLFIVSLLHCSVSKYIIWHGFSTTCESSSVYDEDDDEDKDDNNIDDEVRIVK